MRNRSREDRRLPAILGSRYVFFFADNAGLLTAHERDPLGRRAAQGRGHLNCRHRNPCMAGLFKAVYRKSNDEAKRNEHNVPDHFHRTCVPRKGKFSITN